MFIEHITPKNRHFIVYFLTKVIHPQVSYRYANISLLSAPGDKVEKMTQHEGKGGMAPWAKYLSRRAAR